jgi:hypothetical protein
MKKALITGITGQDGSYLVEFLLEKGYEVHGIIRRSSVFTTQRLRPQIWEHPHFYTHHGDLADSSNLHGLIQQLKPDEISKIEGVDLVLGANEKFSILEHLRNLDGQHAEGQIHTTKINKVKEFRPSCSRDDRTRYFLKVQDGCDYYCTYCTIPFARGRSRSASVAENGKAGQKQKQLTCRSPAGVASHPASAPVPH